MSTLLAKPQRGQYQAFIPFTLAGIPCQIGVLSFTSVPPWRGSPHTCPSSDDYYGYTDLDYEILDRKGYRARWLEAKIDVNPLLREAVEIAIHNHYSKGDEE